MALWIGNQISGPDGLFYANKEVLESKGAKVYINSPVESIDFDGKTVTALVDGKEHVESYDKLILATGSQPILPPIDGAEIKEGSRTFEATLENLQFVKLFQNAQEVIDKLNDKSQDIKRVAVVGAGYIGVELAEASNVMVKKLSLLMLLTHVWQDTMTAILQTVWLKIWKTTVSNWPLAKLLKQ